MTRLTLNLSDELDQRLEEAAKEQQSTKSDIIRKAFTLYMVAREGKQEGKKLGLTQNGQLVTEIVGL